MEERKRIDFLGVIEEPDYSIRLDNVDFNDQKQWDAYMRQTRRNQYINIQKELLAQYQAGVIDKDGNSLVKRK